MVTVMETVTITTADLSAFAAVLPLSHSIAAIASPTAEE
jgi:hypothetical protein